ncbi:MAG: hypothetical protein L3J30_10330 [Marinosulfonomonas sp.]|nr:hypothetical protein [Marinosulfonomonas sp.]
MIGDDARNKIASFWQMFERKADAIDRMLSQPDGGTEGIVEIMQARNPISPDLMWEFGSSDRGHKLCITAGFRDELRPLARLVMRMAPNLSRWQFVDVRPAENPDQLEQIHSSRFNSPITLGKIEASVGSNGRIDQVGEGVGSKDDLNYQILNISALLLGEELERDWIGYVDAVPSKAGGLFGIFGRNKPEQFEAAAWLEMMNDLISEAQAKMPDVPTARADIDTRPVVLSTTLNLAPDHHRNDLTTFYAANETYMQGVLGGARFSSRCHSRFEEWFMYLRIPRTKDMPFDQIEDRTQIEDRLHRLLSTDGLGGVVAAGHGTDHIYIDIGVRNVQLAVGRIKEDLQGEDFAARAMLQLLDQGVADVVVPIRPDGKNRR